MLNSTAHWQPLVNGYSDHIPADFRALATMLATFPSRESFDALRDRHVRYLTFTADGKGMAERRRRKSSGACSRFCRTCGSSPTMGTWRSTKW